MSTATNTDFLRFSAYSMKDLITKKLSQDNRFTDQIYEGSNLATLIDIVSYMYQCLIFQLNNAASESMWSDTQIYENINRLCKFLGYNPKGVGAANALLLLDNSTLDSDGYPKYRNCKIPKYSAIDVGKTDSNGKKVYYSTDELKTIDSSTSYEFLAYNGCWKLYSTLFTSSGKEYQTFILDGLKSDYENAKYVVQGMIHVYVDSNNGASQFEQYTYTTDGLFTDNNIGTTPRIYSSTDKLFNLRLNENKTFEIMFGNGKNGVIPPKDSVIYIFYLESNGPDGELEPAEITNATIIHSPGFLGLSQQVYDNVFGSETTDLEALVNAKISNKNKSSTAVSEETVEQIRNNAPNWFKTGNRLVTANDYEYYIKNRFRDNIVDVVCQNNWQYISTFYSWLYNLGLTKHTDDTAGMYYINQNKMKKHDLSYADAADSNNIYLWIKMRNDSDIYRTIIDDEIVDIKDLTQEPVYVKPLNVYFTPCAENTSTASDYFDSGSFDPDNLSYIEITINNNTLYSNTNIQKQVADIIINYFSDDNVKLGQIVNYSDIANQILQQIPTIDRIRTIYSDSNGTTIIRSGLSFASWTSDYIDTGDDLDINNCAISLESFQWPTLYQSSNLINKIKVIKKSINSIVTAQY